jgi:diguanylate cyclase (GGDEF)-like protein/PAS domain S-box-containing protein
MQASHACIFTQVLEPEGDLNLLMQLRDVDYFNVNIHELFGFAPDEKVSAQRIWARVHADDLPALMANFNGVMQGGGRLVDHEFRVWMPDQQPHWFQTRILIERDAGGAPTHFTGVSIDITDRKLAEELATHNATHDALTGLPNRAMFSSAVAHAVDAARRYHKQFALLFIDLDRFKAVNDTLGHAAGDQLLNEVAQRFKACVRASDIVARLGGDEFVALVDGIDSARQAATVAAKLIDAASAPFEVHGQTCHVSASVGICLYPGDGHDELTLMRCADLAMYRAKESGRNAFCFHSTEA